MSSKAETISDLTSKQPRLSIFFRNPLLLKIVAWLGSLGFIGSSGIVWADLKPISTAGLPKQERVNAPVVSSAAGSISNPAREIYGPSLPVAPKQVPIQIAPEQLPNREVPIAVAPSSAAISPTGTIVPPQHTDILTADNYTVGVNGSLSNPLNSQGSIDILVPAPLSNKIPERRARERVSSVSSQIQPSYLRPQTVNQTSANSSTTSTNRDRTVPKVTSLPGVVPNSTSNSTRFQPPVLTQMRPAATTNRNLQPGATSQTTASVTTVAPDSIQIAIPSSGSSRIEVRPVAQLPIVTTRTVPIVPAIPSVRPAASGRSPSTPIAFVNPGNEQSTQIVYPLSSPAPITSSFGWRTHPITGSRRFHSGVDIGAPMGAPVVAAGSGVIVSAGWQGGYGKAIVIQHNGIQQTLYGHLSEVFVQPGQRIERGMVIGQVGSTGNSTGPHLHFETRVATSDGWIAIDPGEDIKYALDDLRRSMPFAQRELPQDVQ
ncbi:M23 family metallopeptidase [Chamaesiphon sp. OTE_20_metabat_361]|uniref:M23 family metallopeptidase n=1 Tax=Chamaesiphon sp. OTE_20_metabat_361 TaxID=2964689 RepID=UPI00286A37F9|nr:M23 family metallopeptidase [Chamaesiphon sp. OTE_20_metabat_361]